MSLNNLKNLFVSPINPNYRFHRRNINRRNQRRIQRQRHRIITRMRKRRALLRQFAQLPLQITNDPFGYQIFNGSSFY